MKLALGVGELGGKLVEVEIIGMNQRIDFAKAEKVVARLQAQYREHRVRPEDAAAGEVPIPQAATAAIERGVDAAAHGFVDLSASRARVACQ